MAESHASSGDTSSVAVMRSPGAVPSSSATSFTAYGMVMAGMKLGMSPCFTRISRVAGRTASTCPVSW